MCAPLCATGGRPAATLAISVAVSRASHIPPLIPTPPKCGMRSAECGMDRALVDFDCSLPGSNHPLQFRTPHSAFRTHEALHGLSSELLELAEVRCLNVRQVEVPIERWRPWPRALGPFDQDDGPVAYHVVESQVLRLGRGPEAVAVDVIDHAALGRAVLVDQRVRRTGGEPSSTQPPADRLDERGLAGAELTGQPDDDRRREFAAERLTEPVEGVRREAHAGSGRRRRPPPANARQRTRSEGHPSALQQLHKYYVRCLHVET